MDAEALQRKFLEVLGNLFKIQQGGAMPHVDPFNDRMKSGRLETAAAIRSAAAKWDLPAEHVAAMLDLASEIERSVG